MTHSTHINKAQGSVVVIGAGIIGVCTALSLQAAGYQVTIVDPKGVAQGASKGNAGHFATEQVFPLADKRLLPKLPSMLLSSSGPVKIRWRYFFKILPWFWRFLLNMKTPFFNHNKDALKSLNALALKAYEPLLQLANAQHLVVTSGSLLVTESDDLVSLRTMFHEFKEENVAVEFWHHDELKQKEPNLSDKIKAAIYFPEVGHTVDPELLCKQLFNGFLKLGGRFKKSAVVSLEEYKAGLKTGVRTHCEAQFSLNSDHVVIACGAWSKHIVNQLGYQVPLDTERGYHLMLNAQHQVSMPVASLERKFIMTPMSQGLRLAGSVEFGGLKLKPNPKRARVLYPQAQALLTTLPPQSSDDFGVWMGFRPSLPDSLPVIGLAPNHPSVCFAFGHQHLGLTQAAVTAQLITELLSQRPTSVDLTPFCISRFN